MLEERLFLKKRRFFTLYEIGTTISDSIVVFSEISCIMKITIDVRQENRLFIRKVDEQIILCYNTVRSDRYTQKRRKAECQGFRLI